MVDVAIESVVTVVMCLMYKLLRHVAKWQTDITLNSMIDEAP